MVGVVVGEKGPALRSIFRVALIFVLVASWSLLVTIRRGRMERVSKGRGRVGGLILLSILVGGIIGGEIGVGVVRAL